MIPISSRTFAGLVCLSIFSNESASDVPLDLGKVMEKHVMIRIREGKLLSACLHIPDGGHFLGKRLHLLAGFPNALPDLELLVQVGLV